MLRGWIRKTGKNSAIKKYGWLTIKLVGRYENNAWKTN